MHAHVAMFRFRLGENQTIGPSVLRKLWSEACSSNDVKVSRIASGFGYGEPGYIYSLWASPHTHDLRAIEVAIECRLQKLLPGVTIKLTQLR